MLQLVDIGRQSLDSYKSIIGEEKINELREVAKPLRSLRVLHINATPYGGGVSEILRSLVPLENDLGLDVEWRIISGDEKFFKVTKGIHDALQGEPHALGRREERETYLNYNCLNARELNPSDYDIIIVHDPQPAAMLDCSKDTGRTKWVWRCHIDTSEPNPEVWDFINDFIKAYDKTIFTMKEFIPPDYSANNSVITIAPAIDPLSPKNMEINDNMSSGILSWLGMFPGEPFITQVSRFDKWKDPLGVIEVYRLLKKHVPKIHLALVGSMALDDPTAWDIYSKLAEIDTKDPNLHLFTNLTGVSSVEVNAFQRRSKVVIQKSIREGFGLVVSEALWKKTPVVAGNAGGIPLQLQGGGGFLTESIEESAAKIFYLLQNQREANEMAEAGHEYVKDNFLITRLVMDELKLFTELMASPSPL